MYYYSELQNVIFKIFLLLFFLVYIDGKQYRVVNIAPDGFCGFHAMAYVVFGEQYRHIDIMTYVIKCFEVNPVLFRYIGLDRDDDDNNRTDEELLANHIEQLENAITTGSLPLEKQFGCGDMLALSYGLNITVFQYTDALRDKNWKCFNNSPNSLGYVCVRLKDNHYEVLLGPSSRRSAAIPSNVEYIDNLFDWQNGGLLPALDSFNFEASIINRWLNNRASIPPLYPDDNQPNIHQQSSMRPMRTHSSHRTPIPFNDFVKFSTVNCPNCQRQFDSGRALSTHKRMAHKDLYSTSSKASTTSKPSKSSIITSYREAAALSGKSSSTVGPIECQYCGQVLRHKIVLIHHLIKSKDCPGSKNYKIPHPLTVIHQDLTADASSGKSSSTVSTVIECQHCHTMFGSKIGLIAHHRRSKNCLHTKNYKVPHAMAVIDQDFIAGENAHMENFLETVNPDSRCDELLQDDDVQIINDSMDSLAFKKPTAIPYRRSGRIRSSSVQSRDSKPRDSSEIDDDEPFESQSESHSNRSHESIESYGPITRKRAKQLKRLAARANSTSENGFADECDSFEGDSDIESIEDAGQHHSTEERHLRDDFAIGVNKLRKHYGYICPKDLKSSCENYRSLVIGAKEYELNQKTLVNEKKPQELLDIVKNPEQIGLEGRPLNGGARILIEIDKRKQNREVIQPEWSWISKLDSRWHKYKDRVFQLWIKKECVFDILECTQCDSVLPVFGKFRNATICINCMNMNTKRNSEAKEKIEKHLKEMKPQPRQTNLPELSASEKAIIAPVQPVVTVIKNFLHKTKFKQECINLLRRPDTIWSSILPQVSLEKRFVVIEKTYKGMQRGMKINVTKIYTWLKYLFQNHVGFKQLQQNGALQYSEAAMKDLEKNKNDVLRNCTLSSSDSEASTDDDDDAMNSNSRGIGQTEQTADLTKNEVFCFDSNPGLYMKKRDFIKVKDNKKIAIIPDTQRMIPTYDPMVSTNMAFPYLYPHGEKSATDFGKFSPAKLLMKYELQFAQEIEKHKKWRWRFCEDSIAMMHEYARLVEMTAHAQTKGYFMRHNVGASHVPLEQLLDAFEKGPNSFGELGTSIPDMHQLLADFPNSREMWFSHRLENEAMSRDVGDANYFLTLNCEPRSWPDVRKLVYALEFGMDKKMPKDWFLRNNEEFTVMMEKYAVQVSRYLEHKVKTFLRAYFWAICGISEDENEIKDEEKKPNKESNTKKEKKTASEKDWRKSDKMLSGWYWCRPEWTETRGIIHFHIIAKLPNVIDTAIIAKMIYLGRSTRQELRAGNVKEDSVELALKYVQLGVWADRYACKFAESVASASFFNRDLDIDDRFDENDEVKLKPYTEDYRNAWKCGRPEEINCKTNPLMREYNDEDVEQFADNPVKTRNIENAKIAAVCGRHECITNICGGSADQSGNGCRFQFPHKLLKYTVCCIIPINADQVELQVLIRRTEDRVPNLNQDLLRYWRNNHDSTPLFDAGHKLR
jgi:hypothetical protein